MKTIINKHEAICTDCGASDVIAVNNMAMCQNCRSFNLCTSDGKEFSPVYGETSFYKASKYTPELPDRRRDTRKVAKILERRHA